LGFASSRVLGKQLVSHKMFELNGKRMNIPSVEVKVGDIIALKTTKKDKTYFKNLLETLKNKKDVPHWLELDTEKMTGKVVALPNRQDVGVQVDAQMVVEYYSK